MAALAVIYGLILSPWTAALFIVAVLIASVLFLRAARSDETGIIAGALAALPLVIFQSCTPLAYDVVMPDLGKVIAESAVIRESQPDAVVFVGEPRLAVMAQVQSGHVKPFKQVASLSELEQVTPKTAPRAIVTLNEDTAKQLAESGFDITTLHGGGQGFGQRNWTVTQATATEVTLSLHHPDGLGGFPGNIDVTVRYALDDAGALIVEITGQSDRETVFNPAFHGYWALDGTADVGHHRMTIHAERYLPVDAAMIPCGAPAPVAGTIYDYRSAATPDPALDHNFCLSDARTDMRPVLTLETDGLRLDLSTTEPGLQVYTGATIDTAPFAGLGGAPYTRNAGIAIEPQVWPDAPNHPDYPSAALLPGQTYRQVSRFAVTRKT